MERALKIGGQAARLRLAEPSTPNDHLVALYDTDAALVDCVGRFLQPALAGGDSAVLVTTEAHREQIEAALTAEGTDTAAARRGGRLLTADADELLDEFMVGGAPDPVRFTERAGELLDRAARSGRAVRVHGEMVVRLWDRGEIPAALALEKLWNGLSVARAFALLCAYPLRCFDDAATPEWFREVCRQHTAVLPNERPETAVRLPRPRLLEADLLLARELGWLRSELIATLMADARPALGTRVSRLRPTAATFQHTATEAVRRVLGAVTCTVGPGFLPPGAVRVDEASDAGTSVTAAVAVDGSVHGTLRVDLDGAHRLSADEVSFIQAIAQLIAVATEHRLAQRDLQRQALTDRITGLATRALLQDRLAQAVRRCGRQGGRVAVLFVDLDRFKPINDGFGHGVGDQVLAAAAGRLQAALRPSDTLARLGGDEFAAVCETIHGEIDALTLGRRLHEALASPVIVGGAQLSVGASIGVAVGGHGDDPEALLHDADSAMYEAKALGGGRVQLFNCRHREAALARLDVTTALRRALREDELRLAYQPQVELATGRVLVVEALLRWQHPTRGLLPAGEFLSTAQASGLGVALDEWALRAACGDAVGWTGRAGAPPVAVNLCPEQLLRADVLRTVAEALGDTGLPADRLWVEVTADALARAADDAVEALRALAGLGVSIAVDDFGAGSASLAQLRGLPVDAVKIDRSFVRGLDEDRQQEALVAAAVQLARALGATAVAEGVETRGEAALLRRMGCDRAQGHRWSRPVDAATLRDILR